jgi:hypothetical protein
MSRPIVLILSMGGSFLAVPHNTATWHIAMPAEEPSTASEADAQLRTPSKEVPNCARYFRSRSASLALDLLRPDTAKSVHQASLATTRQP